MATAKTITVTRAQEIYHSWASDVLVYIVVLNLFVEWVPNVIIDSFTISIFTAVVLKILLEIITRLEHRVAHWFGEREGFVARVLRPLTMFAILFLSKFVILEIIDIIFGDHVELGGLIEVIALVLSLIIVRYLLRWFYLWLGENDRQDSASEIA